MSDLIHLFEKYKKNTIAIYGLGMETEKILNLLGDQFQIVGLLDGYREDGILYGFPIISLHQAVSYGVKLIIVAARPGSCKAIAKRIGQVCMEKEIALIDVRGKNLCENKQAVYFLNHADGVIKDSLRKKLEEYDVVSVDLFDTLIMRQTLFPTDIFEIVDCKLQEQGIVIKDFCGKRMESEKTLTRTGAPTLTDIYAELIHTESIHSILAEELAQMEWSVDCELLVQRRELCEVIAEIYQSGKAVYIVSDTYYTRKQIERILQKCGMDNYTDLLLSCEYGTDKSKQLFCKLKERTCKQSCIHMGDDIVADIESAEKNGIAACHLYSGMELFEMAGYLGLWDQINDLSDRIKMGMFVARLFNSPFQFETKECAICVNNAQDIGYLFFAPMISDFVLWFAMQVEKAGLKNVWFCARDGYLIKKLYDSLNQNTESIYFLTSRSAAIRAGVMDEADLAYVAEMRFSGTLQQQMKERFGMVVSDERTVRTLMDYKEDILARASVNRRNYQRYIDQLPIKEGDIAFFDFVAKGTSQMYLGRLLNNHLRGFYFLQLDEQYMQNKELDIVPFYKNEEKDKSAIFENYYILETMLTSPEPSVKEFDMDGTVHYAQETRNKGDIQCFLAAQEGIWEFFTTYQKICPQKAIKINKNADEMLLTLIHGIRILDLDFLSLKVEDPFFNRVTDIKDLI